MHVAIISVLYNSPHETLRLVESLLSLDMPSGCVVTQCFIDNSGSEAAAANAKLVGRLQGACYVHMSGNSGSAGGFAAGMRMALSDSADYLWLLDQDGTVAAGALGALAARAAPGEIQCPVVADRETSEVNENFAVCIRWPFRLVPGKPANAMGTHGVFIPAAVVRRIGPYDDRHYFVGYEDYDYGLRAVEAGFCLRRNRDALVYHPSLRRKNRIGRWKGIDVAAGLLCLPFNRELRRNMPLSVTSAHAYFVCRHFGGVAYCVVAGVSLLSAIARSLPRGAVSELARYLGDVRVGHRMFLKERS